MLKRQNIILDNLGIGLNSGYLQEVILDDRAYKPERRYRRSAGLPYALSLQGVSDLIRSTSTEIIGIQQGTEKSGVSPQAIGRSDVSPQGIENKGMITFQKET